MPNGCRSELRRRIRAERRAAPDPVAPDPVCVEATDLIERCEMRAALRRLPARQREVITLRLLLDLDTATTARVLGMPEGTVSSHLHRGLAALRREIPSLDDQELTR